MSGHYGIFDAALYEERGGYPLPPPPPPRKSHAGTIIAAIEGALLVAVIVLIAIVSDQRSQLPTVSDDAPCWAEPGVYCGPGQIRVCSDQVVDLRPLRTCVQP